jgi:hypothetical protein
MTIKRVLVEALTVFSISLVVSIIVTWLWNLTVHKTSAVDWETSFRFAILLGIILPWMGTRSGK